jgi:hypothetical protein
MEASNVKFVNTGTQFVIYNPKVDMLYALIIHILYNKRKYLT